MDKEKNYWSEQIQIYNALTYDKKDKYYEWLSLIHI